tara:strand:- start:12964 stop:13812 length:849 start_codon:yes stop_codon:yes gene_type:complete
MEVDLNINHYDLESLVKLFKIPIQFDDNDLKRAKKVVLATHPDKSKLDKKYFLFFSKAYKILYQIYQFKTKSIKKNVQEYNDMKYNDTQEENDYDKQRIIDKLSNSENFIQTFNTLFEKHYIQDNATEHGYGNWLSSNEDIYNISKQDFETLKKKTRELVVHNKIEGMNTYTGDILGGEVSNYSTSQYEDLKTAYTDALVLGVDERDFKQQYGNLDHLKQARYNQNVEPLTKEESFIHMNNNKNDEDKVDTTRAYRLIKEQENHKKANDAVWASLLRISHNK